MRLLLSICFLGLVSPVLAESLDRTFFVWGFEFRGKFYRAVVVQPSSMRASFAQRSWVDRVQSLALELGFLKFSPSFWIQDVSLYLEPRERDALVNSQHVSKVSSVEFDSLVSAFHSSIERFIDKNLEESEIQSTSNDDGGQDDVFTVLENIRDYRSKTIAVFEDHSRESLSEILLLDRPILTFSVFDLRGPHDLALMENRLIGTDVEQRFLRPIPKDNSIVTELYWPEHIHGSSHLRRDFRHPHKVQLVSEQLEWPDGGVVEGKKLSGPGVDPAIQEISQEIALAHGFYLESGEDFSSHTAVIGPKSNDGIFELPLQVQGGEVSIGFPRKRLASMVVCECPEGAQERRNRRYGFERIYSYPDPHRDGKTSVWMAATREKILHAGLRLNAQSQTSLSLKSAVVSDQTSRCKFSFSF